MISIRSGLVVPLILLFLYANQRTLLPFLFPNGLPQKIPLEDRPSYAEVDPTNNSLCFEHGKSKAIYERLDNPDDERLLRGPETVFFGPDGTMFTTTDKGYLISLTDFVTETKTKITAKTTLLKDLGPGRPLGAKFTPDGNTLYIADGALGLLRVVDPMNPKSKVEIVASKVIDNGQITPITFADDVTIGPKTGRVYFTDGKTNWLVD